MEGQPTTTDQESLEGTSTDATPPRPFKKPKTQTHVRVGVGVLVKDPSRPHAIFAGIRKGSHGAGSLALPGGHLELYESWKDCAIREIQEEMGLILVPDNIIFAHVTNDIMMSESKHYVTIFMMATCMEGAAPKNMEPDKCEGWKSYTWQELKNIHADPDQPGLFGPLAKLMEEDPASVIEFLA